MMMMILDPPVSILAGETEEKQEVPYSEYR
jgi:hypothetical protein